MTPSACEVRVAERLLPPVFSIRGGQSLCLVELFPLAVQQFGKVALELEA